MLITSPFCTDAVHVNAYRDQSDSTTSSGISSSMRLETDSGWKKASDIVAGDQVLTLDHGLRTVWNVSRKPLNARKDALPLVVTAGAVRNGREFIIPEQQVILIESDHAEQITGSRYCLVRACDLIGYKGISKIVPPKEFEVVSLEFQNDEIVCAANGSLLLFSKSRRHDDSDEVSLQEPVYRVLSSELTVSLIAQEKSAAAFHTLTWETGKDAEIGCRCAESK